ncbi:MAG: hydroxyacid dehydrogenase [Candidatus Falkowbacteria bacterium]
MQIAIFDTKPWEKKMMSKELKKHQLKFFTTPLHETKTADFANAEIVSVFVSSKVTTDIIKKLPKLKMIATRSTGYDHIDLKAAKAKGVIVCSVPSYGENTVAEHAFALILSLSRNIHKSYLRSMREDYTIEGLKGFDLQGKTLGVIGAGKIGMHAIRIGRGFGMNVLAYDCFQNEFLAETLNYQYASLEELLKKSDVITIHVPAIPETFHMINKNNVKLIKKGALLVNTARGSVVETEALLYALDNKILAGAGLDVLEEEDLIMEEKHLVWRQQNDKRMASLIKNHILLSKDNVVFTPHIGFYSQEACDRITKTTIADIQAYVAGQPINLIK